jgi:hypothetical protein
MAKKVVFAIINSRGEISYASEILRKEGIYFNIINSNLRMSSWEDIILKSTKPTL